MNHLKIAIITYGLPVIAAFAVAYGYQQTNNSTSQLCKHSYALCTSAKCIPDPNDPTKAICSCNVEEGESMSTASCRTLEPSVDENGIRTIYSTFSFKQFNEGRKGMKCPSGTPWTWCLNKRCTVDPADSKKAICVCDIIRTGEWMTLGGNCDASTCGTGYWSGATIKEVEDSGNFLIKELGLEHSPVKWCPVVNP